MKPLEMVNAPAIIGQEARGYVFFLQIDAMTRQLASLLSARVLPQNVVTSAY